MPVPDPLSLVTTAPGDAVADLHRRLLTLVTASGSLIGTPDLDAVLPATIRIASELVAADGYAVWRFDQTRRLWDAIVTAGVSADFMSAMRDVSTATSTRPLSFTIPLAVTDVTAEPTLEARVEAYRREGIHSVLIVPLSIRDSWSGTLVFYCRQPRVFSDVDIQTAQALGNLAAAAIATAELYEEQRRRRMLSEFLAEAGARLASTLDVRETLASVAQLVVPRIADWCAVDLVTESGEVERLAVAHADPARIQEAIEIERRWSSGPHAQGTARWVIRDNQPVLVPRITEEMLVHITGDHPERLAAIRALGLMSYMCVPLPGRERVAGAITFAASNGGREFTDDDLRFAQELASRIGIAVENARAYEEARRANRVKDDFLATLSHELRTPLNAILGYVHMMRSGAVPEEREEHAMRVIERNATALAQIVADVLEVSRIAAGKLRLTLQPVDIVRVVHESVETVAPAAEEKKIALTVATTPEPVLIQGDADRLQQAVWNLLSNAIKFTPDGGSVRVALAREENGVCVTVRDSGVGIPARFLPHIFEPFHQADSGPSREFGGLGLGLAIVRRIVELHGGSIEAESDGEGRGSEFRITLPGSD